MTDFRNVQDLADVILESCSSCRTLAAKYADQQSMVDYLKTKEHTLYHVYTALVDDDYLQRVLNGDEML